MESIFLNLPKEKIKMKRNIGRMTKIIVISRKIQVKRLWIRKGNGLLRMMN